MKYPTKKQILKDPRPWFKLGLMELISEWKIQNYKGWNNQDPGQKWEALNKLSNIICDHHLRGRCTLSEWSDIDHYDESRKMISLSNLSVLSLLHEIAHHLFGRDELTACRWSVWLYQLRFRKDYNNLVWNEHTLMNPNSKCVTEKLWFREEKMVTTKSPAKQKEVGK